MPIGTCWYSYATTVLGAETEAAACLQVIAGRKFIYPVFVDIEEVPQGTLGKAEYTNIEAGLINQIFRPLRNPAR